MRRRRRPFRRLGQRSSPHQTTGGLLPPGRVVPQRGSQRRKSSAGRSRIGPTEKAVQRGAPTAPPPAKAPTPGAGGSSVTLIIQDTFRIASRQSTATRPTPRPPKPMPRGVVLSTANSYLAWRPRTDGASIHPGRSDHHLSESTDGGLCCDQVVIYDKAHDLFFWLLQYYVGRQRKQSSASWPIAHPADLKANIDNAWTWVRPDQRGTVNSSGCAGLSGSWHVTATDTSMSASDGTDSKGKNGGLIVARMPLSADGGLGWRPSTSPIGYFGPEPVDRS